MCHIIQTDLRVVEARVDDKLRHHGLRRDRRDLGARQLLLSH